GQPELAIQAYQEATRINPRMSDAHYNLGNLYMEKEQWKQAVHHYNQALELRPDWEKAQRGLEQAEAAVAAQETSDEHLAAAAAWAEGPVASGPASPKIDPERLVDPQLHGALLTSLHRATIDSETHGRSIVKIVETEVEPAIKELSSCLLYPDSS